MKRLLLLLTFFTSVHVVFACNNGSNAEPIISGTVIDAATKKPVSDVTITATTVINLLKTEYTVVTDANGQFKIMQMQGGSYKLKFEKDNYKTSEKTNVAIKAETPSKINIELDNLKNEAIEDYHRIFFKYDF